MGIEVAGDDGCSVAETAARGVAVGVSAGTGVVGAASADEVAVAGIGVSGPAPSGLASPDEQAAANSDTRTRPASSKLVPFEPVPERRLPKYFSPTDFNNDFSLRMG